VIDVLQKHNGWCLELAGFGSDEDYFLKAIQGMPNIRWHGRVPFLEGLKLSAQADVLLVTYDPAIPNNRYASANKLFEAMMLGTPVIVARGTNMDRIVDEHSCGWVVDYGDAPMLERALFDIQNHPDERLKRGANARIAYETKYSWPYMAQRLISFYGEVTNR